VVILADGFEYRITFRDIRNWSHITTSPYESGSSINRKYMLRYTGGRAQIIRK